MLDYYEMQSVFNPGCQEQMEEGGITLTGVISPSGIGPKYEHTYESDNAAIEQQNNIEEILASMKALASAKEKADEIANQYADLQSEIDAWQRMCVVRDSDETQIDDSEKASLDLMSQTTNQLDFFAADSAANQIIKNNQIQQELATGSVDSQGDVLQFKFTSGLLEDHDSLPELALAAKQQLVIQSLSTAGWADLKILDLFGGRR